jgi:RimJ/RimL family protein N-acetyltransferase
LKPTTAALTLRKATFEDGPFLLAIRNSDDVRFQSKTKDVIPEETHRKWLQAHLGSPESVIWIIEREGDKQGYIRAQRLADGNETGSWLLSIALQPSGRGHGFGSWALKTACHWLRKDGGARQVVAEVFAANVAARRLFEGVGFKERLAVKKESNLVQFALRLG